MKKAVRLFITGSLQSLFYRQFIKQHADAYKVQGFLRNREDGRVEIFIEGQVDAVDAVIAICKRGPKHAIIRSTEEREERLQGFKEFKILNF
ncbi:acylphosphatase [Candidatus Pacearchaeota archaeon]|nr:acylphosphatase [Candidatus Pacearchaeota archaeon]